MLRDEVQRRADLKAEQGEVCARAWLTWSVNVLPQLATYTLDTCMILPFFFYHYHAHPRCL